MDDRTRVETKVTVKRPTIKHQNEIVDGAAGIVFSFHDGSVVFYPIPTVVQNELLHFGLYTKLINSIAGLETIADITKKMGEVHALLVQGKMSSRGTGERVEDLHAAVQALMQTTGKSSTEIKAYLQARIDAAKLEGKSLSFRNLYQTIRESKTPAGKIMRKIEAAQKDPASEPMDVEGLLSGLQGEGNHS